MRNVRKLTPIDLKGDSRIIFDALCEMFVRSAKMARKRPSPIDIAIAPAAIQVIVALEDYFVEEITAEQTAKQLSKCFS